jgi:hypothetical protein
VLNFETGAINYLSGASELIMGKHTRLVRVVAVKSLARPDGFGGLVVSILAEAVGFFGHPKNPQYAFLRRGSKIICPMSQLCGM